MFAGYAAQAESHALLAQDILLNSKATQQSATAAEKRDIFSVFVCVYLTLGMSQMALSKYVLLFPPRICFCVLASVH